MFMSEMAEEMPAPLPVIYSWHVCPLCRSDLGASNLPAVIASSLGRMAALTNRMRDMPHSPAEDDGSIHATVINPLVRACSLEAEYVLATADEAQQQGDAGRAAGLLTRAINICNYIRSMEPGHFTLRVRAWWARAHAARARLEGDAALPARIDAAVGPVG
jgi:hypothetical protein